MVSAMVKPVAFTYVVGKVVARFRIDVARKGSMPVVAIGHT